MQKSDIKESKYEKLYQIIDDGYNNRLPNEMSYIEVLLNIIVLLYNYAV